MKLVQTLFRSVDLGLTHFRRELTACLWVSDHFSEIEIEALKAAHVESVGNSRLMEEWAQGDRYAEQE